MNYIIGTETTGIEMNQQVMNVLFIAKVSFITWILATM